MNTVWLSRTVRAARRAGLLAALLALLAASLGQQALSVLAEPGTGVFFQNTDPLKRTFGDTGIDTKVNDVVMGDINNDGFLDALVVDGPIHEEVSFGGDGQVNAAHPDSLWLNNGDGSFSHHADLPYLNPENLTTSYGNSSTGSLVDFNGDTYLDVLIVNFDSDDSDEMIWLNDGPPNYGFTFFTKFNPNNGVTGQRTRWAVAANLDGDSNLDVITVQAGIGQPAVIYEYTPGAPASTSMVEISSIPNDAFVFYVSLLDVEKDGDLDAVFSVWTGYGSPASGVFLFTNDGSANFTNEGPISEGDTYSTLTGDLNGDTYDDLVIVGFSGAAVYLNNQDGTFSASTAVPTSAGITKFNRGDLGDIDGDSDLDLVLANRSVGYNEIFLNNGSGVFSHNSAFPQVTSGVDSRAAIFEDVDNDGDLDLLVTDSGNQTVGAEYIGTGVSVWLNNTAPVIASISGQSVNEGSTYTLDLSGYASDDGQGSPASTLSYTLTGGSEGTLNPTSGVYSLPTSESDGPGSVPVTFTVSDGAASADGSFDVAILEVNQNPVVASIAGQNATEGALFSLNLSAFTSDADLPANTLSYALTNGSVGTLNPATGAYTWTPAESDGPAVVTVTFTVSDNAAPTPGTDTGSFVITVAEVNQSPVVASIPGQNGTEGVPFSLNLATFVSDADLPANTLSYTLTSGPAGAAITGSLFTWTPGEILNNAQPIAVTFTVSDNAAPTAGTDSGSFNILVAEGNIAPQISSIPDQNALEGSPFSLELASFASDADLPASTLHFALSGGSVGTLADDGTFTWTPPASAARTTVTVEFTVSDGTASTPGSFDILVAGLNQAPVLDTPVSDSYLATFPISIVVTGHDVDAGDTLTFGVDPSSLPTGAAFNATTRTFTWTPGLAQVGAHDITFTIDDGHGVTNFVRTFTITPPLRVFLPSISRAP